MHFPCCTGNQFLQQSNLHLKRGWVKTIIHPNFKLEGLMPLFYHANFYMTLISKSYISLIILGIMLIFLYISWTLALNAHTIQIRWPQFYALCRWQPAQQVSRSALSTRLPTMHCSVKHSEYPSLITRPSPSCSLTWLLASRRHAWLGIRPPGWLIMVYKILHLFFFNTIF